MGLDVNALREVNEDLTKRSEGGGLFFYQKEIGEETDIRILTPRANLNGKYFIEVIEWWINGKRYTDPETFGKPSPIQALVDEALASNDKDLKALAGDREKCRKQSTFWIPLLHLKYNDKDGSFTVVDDKAKVGAFGMMLMKATNKVVTSRKAQVDSDDGITDREIGMNIILSKTGTGMKTEYSAALGDQVEMDEKYYIDVPDVYQMAKDDVRPDDYLDSVIANYLYGDDMLPDPFANRKSESAKEESKPTRPSRDSKKTEDKPATSSRRTTTKVEDKKEVSTEKEETEDKPRRRTALSQLSDLD